MDENTLLIKDDKLTYIKQTFSGFKKNEVTKQIYTSIEKQNVQASLYWCAESVASGYFLELWDIIIKIYCFNIHTANPKLPLYLYFRYNEFKTIINNTPDNNEIDLRNNTQIRRIFSEIVIILCTSTRKYSIQRINIGKNDVEHSYIQTHIRAPDTTFINCFDKEDPTEIFIIINELCYLFKEQNIHRITFWIEWLLLYEKKFKLKMKCKKRFEDIIQPKHQCDVIWLIWEIILHNTTCVGQKQIIQSLFSLFSIRYSKPLRAKRIIVLYVAIKFLFIDNLKLNTPLYTDKTLINICY